MGTLMNAVQFELLKFVDFSLSSASRCKALAQSAFRATFKDSRKRPRIFIYVNIFVCLINVLVFTKEHPMLGLKPRRNRGFWRYAFTTVIWMKLISSLGLFVIYRKKWQRKYLFCQIWCLCEIALLLFNVYIILDPVYLQTMGTIVYAISEIIKLLGMWVIYYLSLELQYSPPGRYDDSEESGGEDGCNIKYFVAPSSIKRNMERRETEHTSIGSSAPPSPSQLPDDGKGDLEFNDSVLDAKSPTRAALPINFFGELGSMERELNYSEIMIPTNHQDNSIAGLSHSLPATLSMSKDNIVISDLMCGGSSTVVSVESER